LVTGRIHLDHKSTWLCFVVREAWFHLQNLQNLIMHSEDYQEWRWGQILTRQTDYSPDDQPPTDEDEEDAQTQE